MLGELQESPGARKSGQSLDVTYHGEELIAPALRQKAAHDLLFREGCYRLGARLIGLKGKKNRLMTENWAWDGVGWESGDGNSDP